MRASREQAGERVQRATDRGGGEPHLRAVFEATRDAMLVVDDDGGIVDGNAAALALLGVPVEALIDLTLAAVFPAGELATTPRTWPMVLRDGRIEGACRLHRPDGAARCVEYHATARIAPGRHLLAVRDVSERKLAEDRCLRLATMGTIAAGVAHEINNPLAAVIANLDFVARGLTAAEAIDASWREAVLDPLEDARLSAEQIRQIMRDLKLFSRPDEERRGPVDLRRVIDSSLRMAWNEIRHRARLVKDYADIPHVDGNDARLGQVIVNLVVNAAQAIREGDVANHEIRVTTRRGGPGEVIVEVRDTGPGIPPEIQQRLFEPFFTTKPIGIGTGLGLSICRRIIHEHGGTIVVESIPGRGTTVRLVLREVDTPEPPRAPEVGVSAPARRGSVLVIDDEPAITRAVRRALAPHYEVTACTAAADALALLRGGATFDVIVCDMMMPQMSGMELHDRLVASLPEHVPSLVFLTGGAFTAAAHEFLERIPNRHLEKPFDARQLRSVIDDVSAARSTP